MLVLHRCAAIVVLFGVVFGFLPASAIAGKAPPALTSIIADVLPTVVMVAVTRTEKNTNADEAAQPLVVKRATGSGFVIDQTGLIATNKHIIERATTIVVTLHDGTTLNATLVGKSMRSDLALLHVTPRAPLPVAHFGNSDLLRVGDTVIAIGNPLGFDDSVTLGVVSGLNRDIMESPYDDYIQTDASINHGNSGGPLLNAEGQVIGMNSVIIASGRYGGSIGLGFAIPSNDVEFVIDQLRQYGRVRPGWIGASVQQVTPELRESFGLTNASGGGIVLTVAAASPAAVAGLQPGDIVLSLNGRDILDVRALARAVAKARLGAPLLLKIWREGSAHELAIHVIEMPGGVPSPPPRKPGAGADDLAPTSFGARLSELDDQVRSSQGLPAGEPGVLVTQTDPEGTAAEAGLKEGDVILMCQQQKVSSPASLIQDLAQAQAAGRNRIAMLISHDRVQRWVTMLTPSSRRMSQALEKNALTLFQGAENLERGNRAEQGSY